MDVSSFYAIVSGINFTLLGLWWVAVKERPNAIAEHSAGARRMAYLVSLQFTLPGTMGLLAQVAPQEATLWRSSFTVAAVLGAAGVLFLGASVTQVRGSTTTVALLRWAILPVYLAIAAFAAIEDLPRLLGLTLNALQIEGVLLAVLVFLGAHLAWVAAPASTPAESEPPVRAPAP